MHPAPLIARSTAGLLLCVLLVGLPPGATAQEQETYLQRPVLGLVVREAPFPLLEQVGTPYGVQVRAVVPDGPAEKAEVRAGDIITALNGSPVYSPDRLKWLMRGSRHGEPVTLELLRDGEQQSVQVEPQPLAAAPSRGPQSGQGATMPFLGIRMQPLTPGLRERLQAPEQGGVLVADVKEDGPAAQSGIEAGDVILRIDRRRIDGIGDIYRAINFFDPGDQVEMELVRDGERQTRTLTLGETRGDRQGPAGGLPGGPAPHWMSPPSRGDWPSSMQELMELWGPHPGMPRPRLEGGTEAPGTPGEGGPVEPGTQL
jgi:membrane-associated protease RseP (regulator of RpoE activity)